MGRLDTGGGGAFKFIFLILNFKKIFALFFSHFSFSKQSVRAYMTDDDTNFYWKKLYIQVIEHTKSYFHITPATASNLNKLKNYMIFCHFKLPSTPTPDKFLDFLQHDFSPLNLLQKAFFFTFFFYDQRFFTAGLTASYRNSL